MKTKEAVLIYSEESLTNPLSVDTTDLTNYQNVVVSNKIIRANQKLTITEKRIISYCIAQIKPEERLKKSNFYIKEFLEKRKFAVSADAFANIYDYKNKNNAYRDLKLAAKTLYERSAQIVFEKEEAEEFVRFVDRVRYNNGSGIVELFFTPDMYLHLFEFDGNFTQYNLKIGTSFKSMYAHRIFELLQSRKDTNTIILPMHELRFILNIPEGYKNYSKIKEKVFEPTAKEFKKFGMTFEVKILKDINNKEHDLITISTNKNVNDIVRELGLTEENRLKIKMKNSLLDKPFVLVDNLDEETFKRLLNKYSVLSKEDFLKMSNEQLSLYLNDLDQDGKISKKSEQEIDFQEDLEDSIQDNQKNIEENLKDSTSYFLPYV